MCGQREVSTPNFFLKEAPQRLISFEECDQLFEFTREELKDDPRLV